eukprot:gene10876-22713_t
MGKGSKRKQISSYKQLETSAFVTIDPSKFVSIPLPKSVDNKSWSVSSISDTLPVSSKEKIPMICLVNDDRNAVELFGILRHLMPILVINSHNLKSWNQKAPSDNSIFLTTMKFANQLLSSDSFKKLKIQTLLNAEAMDIYKFETFHDKIFSSATCIHLIAKVNTIKYQNCSHYSIDKSIISLIQSRVATARKLYLALLEGQNIHHNIHKGENRNNIDDESCMDANAVSTEHLRRAISSKQEALRNKLKVLLNQPIPNTQDTQTKPNTTTNTPHQIESSGSLKIPSVPIKSAKELRRKMLLLGMILDPEKVQEVHCQAEKGRTLAATRWLDGVRGCDVDHRISWGSIRFGASHDDTSRTVRSIVEGFREFVDYKCVHGCGGYRDKKEIEKLTQKQKRAMIETVTETESSKAFMEHDLASKTIRKKLNKCRVIGFGWKCSPRGGDSDSSSGRADTNTTINNIGNENNADNGDGNDWGGQYGKSCGHNEVVMQYLRPFTPMEVLNTHICSKSSPAPGNENYDGCLEFMQQQCHWYRKCATIWDTNYFHFIDENGRHDTLKKTELLHWDEDKIKLYMTNLRYMTISSNGSISTKVLLKMIDFLLAMACGEISLDVLNDKLTRHVLSYILIGSPATWKRAHSNGEKIDNHKYV